MLSNGKIDTYIGIALFALFILLMAAAVSGDQQSELESLLADMREYRLEASQYVHEQDRFFLSDIAVDNITKQHDIWRELPQPKEKASNTLAQSYVEFIRLNFLLNNPSLAEYGLINLDTVSTSEFLATVDPISGSTYRSLLNEIRDKWLTDYAPVNIFDELLPPWDTTRPLSLELTWRDTYLSGEDEYVVTTAERFLEWNLAANKEYFYIRVPPAEYVLEDTSGLVFPKQFVAIKDTAQFLYLTPNLGFNFVPVAKVYLDSVEFYYDTLTPKEFEMIRIGEERADDFSSLEFGRYTFRVMPPYEILDTLPNKLIFPKNYFGQPDYRKKHSELFEKKNYEMVLRAPGEAFTYEKIIARTPPREVTKPKSKKK